MASTRPRLAREARVVRLVAGLLVALLVVMTSRREPPPTPIPTAAPFRMPAGEPLVRVRLDVSGSGPWNIDATGVLLLNGEPATAAGGDRRRGRLSATRSGLAWNGSPVGARLEIASADGGGLQVDGTSFPGRLVVKADGVGAILILHVALETYLTHVVPNEMPLYYPVEALRAQTVASRTYAVTCVLARRAADWDVSDSETSQVFRGASRHTARSARLVEDTRGVLLTFGAKPFYAYFSSNCGGHTRSNGEAFRETPLAPLAGRLCGFCTWSEDHHWTHVTSLDHVRRVLELPTLVSIDVTKTAASGFEAELTARTASGDVPLTARKVRSALGYHKVKSTKIVAVTANAGRLTIEGYGFGHGVGLCQTGARGLAEAGRTGADILAYYFPGAETARMVW